MIHPNANDTLTVRSVFIVGPDKKIKLIIHLSGLDRSEFRRDPAGAGLLQLTANYKARRRRSTGSMARIASSSHPCKSDEEATKLFPQGYKRVKPYLRITPQPNLYRDCAFSFVVPLVLAWPGKSERRRLCMGR